MITVRCGDLQISENGIEDVFLKLFLCTHCSRKSQLATGLTQTLRKKIKLTRRELKVRLAFLHRMSLFKSNDTPAHARGVVFRSLITDVPGYL